MVLQASAPVAPVVLHAAAPCPMRHSHLEAHEQPLLDVAELDGAVLQLLAQRRGALPTPKVLLHHLRMQRCTGRACSLGQPLIIRKKGLPGWFFPLPEEGRAC